MEVLSNFYHTIIIFLKDIFILENIQKIYFFVIALLAILTYKKANETIFMPFKNEVFKRQIDKLEEIYIFFNNQLTIGTFRGSGIEKTLEKNLYMIFYDYIIFNNWDSQKDYLSLAKDNHSEVIFNEKYYTKETLAPQDFKNLDSSKNIFDTKIYSLILISTENFDYLKRLKLFKNTPYLPQQIVSDLEVLIKIVNKYDRNIGDIMEKFILDIPNKIKKNEDIEKFGKEYGLNFWNEKKENVDELENQINIILKNIRKYLHSDNIWNRK